MLRIAASGWSHVGGFGNFLYYARTGSLTPPNAEFQPLIRTPEEARPPVDPAMARRTRTRFSILALLTAGTLINYLDRTVISVAAPLMTSELNLTPVAMGLVFS